MLKVLIATKSNYKINAIKKSLYELDFDFEAESIDTLSGVQDQPNRVGETKEGSINRAKNALAIKPDNDFAIGVEFGYEPLGDSFHMHCWATIVTSSDKTFSEQSSTLELPSELRAALLAGTEVHESLEKVLIKMKDNETSRIFIQYLRKRKFIYQAVSNVAMRYLLDGQIYR